MTFHKKENEVVEDLEKPSKITLSRNSCSLGNSQSLSIGNSYSVMVVKLVRLEYLLHKLMAFLCFSMRMVGIVRGESGLASCRSVIAH